MTSNVTDWNQVKMVHLKGACKRRGIDSEGTKEELVKRLEGHNKTQATNNTDFDLSKIDVHTEPRLSKMHLRTGYDATMALRIVIVDDFQQEMLSDSTFLSFLDDCTSFTIRKTTMKSAAELIFTTSDKGDNAYISMKENGLDVSHPQMTCKVSWLSAVPGSEQKNTIDTIIKSAEPADDFWTRILVIEGLSEEMNNEEKLYELFPEAIMAISYQVDKLSSGIAILEFQSETEADILLKNSHGEVELDGVTIKLYKYVERTSIYQKIQQAHSTAINTKTPDALSDDDRIVINAQINEFKETMKHIQDDENLVGSEKLKKLTDMNDQQREFKRVLIADTRRRVKEGKLNMPESEEDQQEQTKIAVDKAKIKKNVPLSVKSQASNQEMIKSQLTKLDQEYAEAAESMDKLVNKIRSTEGQLVPSEKEKRKHASPIGLAQPAGANVPKLQPQRGPMTVKENLLLKAQNIAKLKNQQATANLMKASNQFGSGSGNRGGGRGGAGNRGGGRGGPGNRGAGRGGPGRGGAAGRGRGGAPVSLLGMARGQKRPANLGGGGGYGRGDYNNGYEYDGGYNQEYGKKFRRMDAIESITNSLTDKMMQLEQMQQATMQTWQKANMFRGDRDTDSGGLLGGAPPMSGGGPMSYGGNAESGPMKGMSGFKGSSYSSLGGAGRGNTGGESYGGNSYGGNSYGGNSGGYNSGYSSRGGMNYNSGDYGKSSYSGMGGGAGGKSSYDSSYSNQSYGFNNY